MKCPSNKKEYFTQEAAIEALIASRISFVGNGAVNVYQCNDCDQWHLTSKGAINKQLQEMIESGKLDEEIKKYEWGQKYRS